MALFLVLLELGLRQTARIRLFADVASQVLDTQLSIQQNSTDHGVFVALRHVTRRLVFLFNVGQQRSFCSEPLLARRERAREDPPITETKFNKLLHLTMTTQ